MNLIGFEDEAFSIIEALYSSSDILVTLTKLNR